MTICGYHPRMGVGIADFSEGLISALVEKSARQGRDLVDHLGHEADEIFIIENFFRNEIAHRKPEGSERDALEAFLGIVAIAKYMMLRELGFDAERLRIVIVTDLRRKLDHAVLLVDIDNDIAMLDNLELTVIPAARAHWYKPAYSFNENGWWTHLRAMRIVG